MARPSPTVIESADVNGVTWEILAAEAAYVVTYQGQIVNIRSRSPRLSGEQLKYYKMSYANLGSAIAAVKRLNEKFNCDSFSYTIMNA